VSVFKKIIPRFSPVFILLFLIPGLFGKRLFHVEQDESSSYPQKGSVTVVYDGDTIRVRFENGQSKKVRLIGVDAPEMDAADDEARFRALMAKRFAFFHFYRKNIDLSYDWELEDTYGRLLAYVWTESEGLFNKFILEEGFASVLLRFPFREDFRKEFMEAETNARSQGKGLWYEGPYPSIELSRWKEGLGKIVTLLSVCAQTEPQGKFFFLHDSGGEFSALIPQESLFLFPDAKKYKGKTLSITGFLEEFKGKPQILVFLPCQIRMVD